MTTYEVHPVRAYDVIGVEDWTGTMVYQNDHSDPTLWCEECREHADSEGGPCVHIAAALAFEMAAPRADQAGE